MAAPWSPVDSIWAAVLLAPCISGRPLRCRLAGAPRWRDDAGRGGRGLAQRLLHDALRLDHDALRRNKEALLAEIKDLKGKLGDEDAAASFTSVKDEPAASDGQPPAGVGSSDSDSSGVLNDTDAADVWC
jgi:hypothetical protein